MYSPNILLLTLSNGSNCGVGLNLFRHLFEEKTYFGSVSDADRFEAALQLTNEFVTTVNFRQKKA